MPSDAVPLDAERTAIASWLRAGGLDCDEVVALVGDVSSRSYFRVVRAHERTTLVVARYPRELAPAQERFRRAGELLASAGVRVPRLLRDDPASGLALLEDVGPQTLYELASSWRELEGELACALDAARKIAALRPPDVVALGSEPLDASLLRRELEQTTHWFLAPHELARPEPLRALDELCRQLGGARLVPCHRDFMARNLIPDGAGGVAVLDFQDLRLGPPGYDLASLLNDSLFAEPALERPIVDGSFGASDEAWLPYRRAVAQRCLKAVGTFVKFAATGRRRHLKLVPPTLERALVQLVRLPETRSAFEPLAARCLAAAETVSRDDLAAPKADAPADDAAGNSG